MFIVLFQETVLQPLIVSPKTLDDYSPKIFEQVKYQAYISERQQ